MMWSMMLELDSNLRSIFSAHVGYITIHELQTRIAEYLDDDRPICTIAEEKARIVFVCPYLIAELAKITESYLFTFGTTPHIIFAYNTDGCFFLLICRSCLVGDVFMCRRDFQRREARNRHEASPWIL